MDSVVHWISCFAACSHKEEGQSVTGGVKEALPVPGGLGLGIRDEGRGREVWWEDGAELIYVPQERKKMVSRTALVIFCGLRVRA